MIIAVIDGMGGGIGAQVIDYLRSELPGNVEIYALGTNAIATSAMMKNHANKGATGENAIIVSSKKANVIVGSMSIVIPNSMMGEITEKMALGISESDALKVLIPILPENFEIIGVEKKPLLLMIKDSIDYIRKEFNIKRKGE